MRTGWGSPRGRSTGWGNEETLGPLPPTCEPRGRAWAGPAPPRDPSPDATGASCPADTRGGREEGRKDRLQKAKELRRQAKSGASGLGDALTTGDTQKVPWRLGGQGSAPLTSVALAPQCICGDTVVGQRAGEPGPSLGVTFSREGWWEGPRVVPGGGAQTWGRGHSYPTVCPGTESEQRQLATRP